LSSLRSPAQTHSLCLRTFAFEGGDSLNDVEIGYWTMGGLNARRDNALLIHHNASGTAAAMRAYCGAGLAFDPDDLFLIAMDAPGGGASSRRSKRRDFPVTYSVGDCANAAARLLDHLDLPVRAFCGPSFASLIGLELAARRPDRVGALVFWQGGYRASGFARASAEALAAAILEDSSEEGWNRAARAFFLAVAGKGVADAMGEPERDESGRGLAREWRRHWRPDELASRYRAIARSDVATAYGGEVALAAKIQAPMLWLQALDDAVFPLAQVETLLALMPNATLKTIDTPLGHLASAAPPESLEQGFFARETRAFLQNLRA
jgi:homoserine acetyltransferase